MKKLAVFLVLAVMLSSVLLVAVPASAMYSGGGNSVPTPGTMTWGSDWKGTDTAKNATVQFYNNEAYPAWAAEPYIYATAIWNGAQNEQVIVEVKLTHGYLGGDYIYWHDKNGHAFYSEDSNITADRIRARLYQPAGWKENTTNTADGDTKFIKPFSVSIIKNPDNPEVDAYFSFQTNTHNFTNGVFAVEVQLKVFWTHWVFWTESAWESFATIYGEFSWGEITNTKITQDVNATGEIQLQGTVFNGIWDIQLWYAGDDGNWNVTSDGVHRSDGKAYMVKDFGTFSASQNPNYNLNYTFNDSAPSGIYLWVFYSKYKDGKILKYFSVVIHNNKKDLATQGWPPTFKISFKYSGTEPEINHQLTIVINVTGTNGQLTYMWLIGYYGAQLNTIPPNTGGLVAPFFNYPLSIDHDGQKEVNLTLKLGGQFNVIIYGKRSNQNVTNITMNSIMVKDFEGSGGGNPNGQPKWFSWPWESTENMVILLFGVILIFSRRPTLQIIGIFLFFASFVNWHYISMQIQAGANPLNWFKGVILR